MRRMLATEVHRRLISDCNERDPRSGAVPPLRRFGIALVPRLPVLGGYPAATPRFAPPCAGADCGDPPGIDPPGSGRFCRKTGSNLTPFRGSGRLFRFLAAIRVDVYGIAPGQKHSHRRVPCSAACETAQNLARALCRTSDRAKNGVMGLRNRPELCSCVRPPSAG